MFLLECFLVCLAQYLLNILSKSWPLSRLSTLVAWLQNFCLSFYLDMVKYVVFSRIDVSSSGGILHAMPTFCLQSRRLACCVRSSAVNHDVDNWMYIRRRFTGRYLHELSNYSHNEQSGGRQSNVRLDNTQHNALRHLQPWAAFSAYTGLIIVKFFLIASAKEVGFTRRLTVRLRVCLPVTRRRSQGGCSWCICTHQGEEK